MTQIQRRTFLKGALAATAFSAAPFNILKAGPSPNSKMNVALIGCGGQGVSNARELRRYDNIVALCDVHESWANRKIGKDKQLRSLKKWKDYREMLDSLGDKLDAVIVATPEHNHYTISMCAMRHGKHVYCQKPLCHTVNEVRLLTQAARKYKVVTQMGNQGHSSQSAANIRDWVQDGAIGDIREVIAYSRKLYWIPTPPSRGDTCPKDLDWNLFLNRAGDIPFSNSYMNRNWIKYNHFSGAVGDMGAHTLDPGFYSLDLGAPLSVRAEVIAPAKPWSLPPAGVVIWEFPARGKMPPVTMKFYLGGSSKKGASNYFEFPRPKHLEAKRRGITAGTVLVGEKASIMAGSHSQSGRIIPEATMKKSPRPSGKSPRNKGKGHFGNWSMACKGKDTAMSNFDYAGPLSEVIVLGDIALMHPGKTLKWDAPSMKITNDDAANKDLFMRRLNPRDDVNWI